RRSRTALKLCTIRASSITRTVYTAVPKTEQVQNFACKLCVSDTFSGTDPSRAKEAVPRRSHEDALPRISVRRCAVVRHVELCCVEPALPSKSFRLSPAGMRQGQYA